MNLEAMAPQLKELTHDWSNGVDHGPYWVVKIVGTKYNVVEGAWRIADLAMDVSGGYGMFKKSELERLFRDARAGRFHPANSALTHELIGKTNILVVASHQLTLIEELCTKAVFLDRGEIRAIGSVGEVIDAYKEFAQG